jgi:nucleoside-diphosphate-sugar epimerase
MNLSKLVDKKILVTGGSGFFPSHLVKTLLDAGAREIYVTTKYNSVIDNVRLASSWSKIIPVEADLRNPDSLKQISQIKPQVIFHMAAYNHVGDSFLHVQEALTSNSLGTANLMEAYTGYEKFIYIATSEVYGYQTEVPFREDMLPYPTSPYSVGKYAGELFAQMQWHVNKYPIVLLRPFNAFGPYQSARAVIAEIIIKCLLGETIKSTEGIQTRDFNYVTNLVDGVLRAAISEKAVGQIINIGSGVEITIADLIKKIHALTESRSELQIGALEYRPTEIWRMAADWTRAREILDWSPEVSLDEGLRLTVDWYKRYLKVYTQSDSPLLSL